MRARREPTESDTQMAALVRRALAKATRFGFVIPLLGAGEFVRVFLDLVAQEAKLHRVLLPGFGVFEVRTAKKRKVYNPATGEVMTLPPTRSLKFRATKAHRGMR